MVGVVVEGFEPLIGLGSLLLIRPLVHTRAHLLILEHFLVQLTPILILWRPDLWLPTIALQVLLRTQQIELLQILTKLLHLCYLKL